MLWMTGVRWVVWWCLVWYVFFFFFKQKTAYEMRISDWSSDVCSSDLAAAAGPGARRHRHHPLGHGEEHRRARHAHTGGVPDRAPDGHVAVEPADADRKSVV